MRFMFWLVIACSLVACGSDGSGSDGGCVLSQCDPDCPGLPLDGLACANPGHSCQYEAADYTCGSDGKWHCHPVTASSSNYPCPPLDMAHAGD